MSDGVKLGLCKLVRAVILFIVPPKPLQGYFSIGSSKEIPLCMYPRAPEAKGWRDSSSP